MKRKRSDIIYYTEEPEQKKPRKSEQKPGFYKRKLLELIDGISGFFRNPESVLWEEKQLWEQAENFFLHHPENIKFKAGRDKFVKMANHHIYKIIKQLGKGSFGTVYKVQDYEGKEHAAKKEKFINFSTQIDQYVSVLKIMKKLGERGKLESDVITNDMTTSYVLMDLKQGVTLEDTIFSSSKKGTKKGLELLKRLKIGLKCVEAAERLHDENIVHADLKPANFIVKDEGDTVEVSTIDYGFSIQLESDKQVIFRGAVGTPFYMGPEFFVDGNRGSDFFKREVPFSKATDIYALGVMLKEDLDIDLGKDFNDKILHEDPAQRSTIKEIRQKLEEKISKVKKEMVEEEKKRIGPTI